MAPKQCRFMLNTNPAIKVGAAPFWTTTTTSSTIITTTSTTTKSSSSRSTARYGRWDRDGDLQGTDKIKACVPYILPILDGDHFGHYIYERIPPLSLVHDILLGGLLQLWDAFPFSGLILFIALTIGTRGNTEMDRNVRFSAQAGTIALAKNVQETRSKPWYIFLLHLSHR